mmetsp:Transcript_17390/g.36757  ORF Transcript_17390/g.36757 Transcript_17390/m.36757 type:complete len:236 (+) Transcript_17390:1561-2268(+)
MPPLRAQIADPQPGARRQQAHRGGPAQTLRRCRAPRACSGAPRAVEPTPAAPQSAAATAAAESRGRFDPPGPTTAPVVHRQQSLCQRQRRPHPGPHLRQPCHCGPAAPPHAQRAAHLGMRPCQGMGRGPRRDGLRGRGPPLSGPQASAAPPSPRVHMAAPVADLAPGKMFAHIRTTAFEDRDSFGRRPWHHTPPPCQQTAPGSADNGIDTEPPPPACPSHRAPVQRAARALSRAP